MKKLLTILALIPTLLFAQNGQVKGFMINGKVNGIADGEVKITTSQDDHTVIAASTIKDGVFKVNGAVPEPGLYFIVLSNEQPQYIYLENTTINISGTKSDIKNLKIEGS